MNRYALLSITVASVALAQAVAVERAPLIKADHKLACPAGTRQVGGLKSNLQLVACMKLGVEGQRQFHGPMISLYASGKVEAVGQTEEGFRTGKWAFFDEQGVKTGETEFLKGDFNGRRVFFNADGSLKSEENWVKGMRQGQQKTFLNGVATVTEYKDDRPVQK
ncbi:MAG: hypothetical protein IT380_18640 [Myxococcales bacterium]|nr:hypothetical protein [Myxococcales bacterium]